jgi:hypothetical protein
MNYALGMGGLKRVGDINRKREVSHEVQRASGNPMLQGHPIQKFHGDEGLAGMLTNVIDRADVRMIQCRSCLGLTTKSLQRLAVIGNAFGQEFKSNKPVEASVLGLVNMAHTPAAEFFEDAVVRNGLAEKRLGVRHGGGQC